MPELHIERIYKLRNFPSVDVRVVVSSTEGAIMGTAQTGGRMQIRMSTPKAIMITAGVYTPFGAPKPELPSYISKAIQEASKNYGHAACFASRFSVSCTIEGVSLSQEQTSKMLEEIGKKFEQQVEHVEFAEPRTAAFRTGTGTPVIGERMYGGFSR